MSQQTTRTHKPARDLTLGDIVHLVDDRTIVDSLARVEHALPYRDGDGKPWVALTVQPLDSAVPLQRKFAAEKPFRLATEDDLAAAHDAAVRDQLHADLTALQVLIGSVAPRLRPYGRDVSFNVAEGEVERIAAALSQPTRAFGSNGHLGVAWTAPGGDDRGPRLKVEFWGLPAPKPAVEVEVEQEWLFTFGSGQRYDGRFVRIKGTYLSARDRMLGVFGTAWCDQYTWRTFDANGLPASLVELPESEWPSAPDCADGWHSQSGEPTGPCSTCGDQPPTSGQPANAMHAGR